MAWVRVIKKFKDKHTGKVYKPGDKLNLKADRIAEILEAGDFVEEIKTGKRGVSGDE